MVLSVPLHARAEVCRFTSVFQVSSQCLYCMAHVVDSCSLCNLSVTYRNGYSFRMERGGILGSNVRIPCMCEAVILKCASYVQCGEFWWIALA